MEAPQLLVQVLVLVLVLVSVQHSECVRCFANFNLASGMCDDELGEVDEDDCCQNPNYGYQATDSECRSCGPQVWSSWSSWSQCNVLCGDGVRQRSRMCHGIGHSECEKTVEKLQIEPCSGTCCDEKGWSLWTDWSPCSITCEGAGVRQRKRVCDSRPECQLTCSGPAEETETCEAHNTCPVHGGWSRWAAWSNCSASCIDHQYTGIIAPTRLRQRFCTYPAPSEDTTPPGDRCQGDHQQKQDCSELPNCPVDGGWGPWSPPGPCVTPCGEGLQMSIRICNNPLPKYGGQHCDGPSSRTSICRNPCPVNGFWTGWSSWGECSSSCIQQGQAPVRIRHRSCSNPAPSSTPPGRDCQGDDREEEDCPSLPHCPVNGGWGSWSPLSPCPVTCGIGLQVSTRHCDSPAPKYGGSLCPGEGYQTSVCRTNIHCPVDGMWSEWSEWRQCLYPFGGREIRCMQIGGSQTRERSCLHRAHNGSVCIGDNLTERRVCYDVNRCEVRGSWEGWEPWSFCHPTCGENSVRQRRRICQPDYSDYRPTIGRLGEKATFSGRPRPQCGDAPDGGEEVQVQPCLNMPACP